MKVFFIVMTMMIGAGNPNADLYIIAEPSFSTPNRCLAFVDAEIQGLVNKASREYNGRQVEQVYCIEKGKLKEIVTQLEKNKKEELGV